MAHENWVKAMDNTHNAILRKISLRTDETAIQLYPEQILARRVISSQGELYQVTPLSF